MCKQVKSKNLREALTKAAHGRLRNSDFLFNYLLAVGDISLDGNGLLSVCDDLETRIENAVKKVEVGSIAWSGENGMFLVLDAHPKVNDDGHHFVTSKVTLDQDGNYSLVVNEPLVVLEDIDLIFVKSSTFNTVEILRLYTERRKFAATVLEMTEKLKQMREETDNG